MTPAEKSDLQVILQRADLSADCSCGYVQCLGGIREARMTRGHGEHAQRVQGQSREGRFQEIIAAAHEDLLLDYRAVGHACTHSDSSVSCKDVWQSGAP